MIDKKLIEEKMDALPKITLRRYEYMVVDIETIPQELDFALDVCTTSFDEDPDTLARYEFITNYFQERRWDSKAAKIKVPKKKATPEEIEEIKKLNEAAENDYTNLVKATKALEPSLCKICCIGLKTAKWTELITAYDKDKRITDEAAVLKRFWKIALAVITLQSNFRYVTFNGLDFDFPMLEIRSSINDTYFLNLPKRRYTTDKHYDVRMVLSNWNKFGIGNQDFWCNVYGVKGNPDVIKGDEIQKAYLEGDIEAIKAHCEDDLNRTEQLYIKSSGLCK